MENKSLSPKALSKEKHKISAWISISLHQELDRFYIEKKTQMEYKTKSDIISAAIIQEYFGEPYDKIPKSILGIEKPYSRITFSLKPQEVQFLWDIESHYAGKGIKMTLSMIIQLALSSFIYQ